MGKGPHRAICAIERSTYSSFPELKKHLKDVPPEVSRELHRLARTIEDKIAEARRKGQRDFMMGRGR